MNLVKKMSYQDAIRFVKDNKNTIKKYYIKKDLTARKVAERLNVKYDNNFQKALFRGIGKKGKGHGGAREGSGNKKGVRFCPKCKKIKNCIC